MNKKILVVAAHPDDEVLGCGATIAREASEGATIKVVIMATGVTSRYEDQRDRSDEIESLVSESRRANAELGVDDVVFGGFPDQKLDTIPFFDLVKFIRAIVDEFRPDVAYTHHAGDYNLDHRLLYDAVVVSTRPALGEHHPAELYSFEVLSSTEWQPQSVFTPQRYVDVKGTIGAKKTAMAAYASELRDYPHPRSIEGIDILAQKRGLEISREYAEAFQIVRLIDG